MHNVRLHLRRCIFVGVACGGITALAFYGYASWELSSMIPATYAVVPETGQFIAAQGRIEPVSEEIKVSSAIGGRLSKVRVEEGDVVEKGQVMAVLENDHLQARIGIAEAEVKAKRAELERLLNGARLEERREMAALAQEANEMVALAQAVRERRIMLSKSGAISREEIDRAEREHAAAQARSKAAHERLKLVNARARAEDVELAKANLELAQARLEEARAMYEKSFVRAPITGYILRKYKRPGETIKELSETPIISLGDTSVLRVRAEVDERDVAFLKVGLSAYVKADAYGAAKFKGHVVFIGQVLGRKNVHTDDPAERIDTKVLETLIELEPGSPLIPGLRVDTFIEHSEQAAMPTPNNEVFRPPQHSAQADLG
jgi:HlyD family secretion protein